MSSGGFLYLPLSFGLVAYTDDSGPDYGFFSEQGSLWLLSLDVKLYGTRNGPQGNLSCNKDLPTQKLVQTGALSPLGKTFDEIFGLPPTVLGALSGTQAVLFSGVLAVAAVPPTMIGRRTRRGKLQGVDESDGFFPKRTLLKKNSIMTGGQ
ncbi:hypothetical protein DY000_02005196 [Brassica cretica]|uniref:Xylanase inhibitor N-terminal domain-containing protein n=1 Tax=Brassica cretica TaxID=69181 RepID=A0ABQ7CHZ1_BRACR|nr:hypothetical protein DY000_02005196 [Brassica cretica]